MTQDSTMALGADFISDLFGNEDTTLAHKGVKGMKWGKHKAQPPDAPASTIGELVNKYNETPEEMKARKAMVDEYLKTIGKDSGTKKAGGKAGGNGGGGKKKGGGKGGAKKGSKKPAGSGGSRASSSSNNAPAKTYEPRKNSYAPRRAISDILASVPKNLGPKAPSANVQAIIDKINASVDARKALQHELISNGEDLETIEGLLAHYGTMGMKWGVRKDDIPTAPRGAKHSSIEGGEMSNGDSEFTGLDTMDKVIAHYGTLGMKWGVRKDTYKDKITSETINTYNDLVKMYVNNTGKTPSGLHMAGIKGIVKDRIRFTKEQLGKEINIIKASRVKIFRDADGIPKDGSMFKSKAEAHNELKSKDDIHVEIDNEDEGYLVNHIEYSVWKQDKRDTRKSYSLTKAGSEVAYKPDLDGYLKKVTMVGTLLGSPIVGIPAGLVAAKNSPDPIEKEIKHSDDSDYLSILDIYKDYLERYDILGMKMDIHEDDINLEIEHSAIEGGEMSGASDELVTLDSMDKILAHYGVLGMKWGVRNDDRSSGRPQGAASRKKAPLSSVKKMVTPKPKATVKTTEQKTNESAPSTKGPETKAVETKAEPLSARSMTDQELRDAVNRLQMEKTYAQLMAERNPAPAKKAESAIKTILRDSTKQAGGQLLTNTLKIIGTYAIAAAISKSNPALANAMMKGVGDNAKKATEPKAESNDAPDATVSTPKTSNQNKSNTPKSNLGIPEADAWVDKTATKITNDFMATMPKAKGSSSLLDLGPTPQVDVPEWSVRRAYQNASENYNPESILDELSAYRKR